MQIECSRSSYRYPRAVATASVAGDLQVSMTAVGPTCLRNQGHPHSRHHYFGSSRGRWSIRHARGDFLILPKLVPAQLVLLFDWYR